MPAEIADGREWNPAAALDSKEAQVVIQFIERFNANEIDAAMDLLDPDVFYHNIPMEPMRGRENVRTFTKAIGVGTRLLASWRIVNLAAFGDVVLTERVDAFTTPEGRSISIPLMGAFRLRAGLITEWRDYFDLGDFTRQFEALALPA